MDRYPKSNSLLVIALLHAGCAFRSFSSADKLWQQKVFVELMLLQGVSKRKWGGGWKGPNDNGLPRGMVISDTSEYESSGTFRVGAKSQSLRNFNFKIEKLVLKKASHGEISVWENKCSQNTHKMVFFSSFAGLPAELEARRSKKSGLTNLKASVQWTLRVSALCVVRVFDRSWGWQG